MICPWMKESQVIKRKCAGPGASSDVLTRSFLRDEEAEKEGKMPVPLSLERHFLFIEGK